MKELIDLGINFIVYLVDMNVLKDAYSSINKSFKKLT